MAIHPFSCGRLSRSRADRIRQADAAPDRPSRHAQIRIGGWLPRTTDADFLRGQLDLVSAAGWDVAVISLPRYGPFPRLKESPLPLLVDTTYQSWLGKEAALTYPSLVAVLLAGRHVLHPLRYRAFPRWWLHHPREGHVLRPERLPGGKLPRRLRALVMPEFMDRLPRALVDSATATQLTRPFYWLVESGVMSRLTVGMLLSLRAEWCRTSPIPSLGQVPAEARHATTRRSAPAARALVHHPKFITRAGLRIVEE